MTELKCEDCGASFIRESGRSTLCPPCKDILTKKRRRMQYEKQLAKQAKQHIHPKIGKYYLFDMPKPAKNDHHRGVGFRTDGNYIYGFEGW